MSEVKGYNRRYIIPDWNASGETQIFVYAEELAAWYDTICKCWRVQAWIDEHIAPYFKLAPSPRKMMDQIMEENDEQVK